MVMESVKSNTHALFDFICTVPTDVTGSDNVTAGEWLEFPWTSDNAEHFEARNRTSNCTAAGGSDSLCDGNRLDPSFYFMYVCIQIP